MFPETSGSFLGTLSLLDKVISRTHSEGSLRTILLTLKKKKIPRAGKLQISAATWKRKIEKKKKKSFYLTQASLEGWSHTAEMLPYGGEESFRKGSPEYQKKQT